MVIGGGAAGLMAAGRAAESGAEVTLLERMPQPGRKLLVTGKGRCNITNSAPLREFLAAFGQDGRFLYGAFHRFFRDELLEFLRRHGVETKTERGGRIFPVSDSAADVLDALVSYVKHNRVIIRTNSRVTAIERGKTGISGVTLESGEKIPARAVILATGGASYPGTGSAGDGFRLAKGLGHRVTRLYPSLVPLAVAEADFAKACQGVSLKNIRLTLLACDRNSIPNLTINHDYGRGTGHLKPPAPVIESRFGEMMLTHFGIGGPVTLLASQSAARALENGPVTAVIDLKPALSRRELDLRLQRELAANPKRRLTVIMKNLLPAKMVEPMIGLSGIAADKTAAGITAGERKIMAGLLKCLPLTVTSPLPLSAAMVTAGGVELSEIDPRTMASRLVPGLYLAGEVLNLDADTGGYNLQAAFSTGWVAGKAAVESLFSLEN